MEGCEVINLAVEIELVQEISPAHSVVLPVQHQSAEQAPVLAVRQPGTEEFQNPTELQRGKRATTIAIK